MDKNGEILEAKFFWRLTLTDILDFYVVSGGSNFESESQVEYWQDRLYLKWQVKGIFLKNSFKFIASKMQSVGCVRPYGLLTWWGVRFICSG